MSGSGSGSIIPRTVFDVAEHLKFPQAVDSIDITDRSALGTHDKRGCPDSASLVPDSLEQLAVGDSRCGEKDIIRRDKVIYRQNLPKIHPELTTSGCFL